MKYIMEIDKYTDQEIVRAILNRDTSVTKEYLYKKCYPLFCSIYNKYFTDCKNPFELINQIYLYILVPNKKTNRSKLQDFGFRCTLTMWLKIVTENYCYQLYSRRTDIDRESDISSDRNMLNDESISENTRKLDMEDVRKVLDMMPNQRYRRLIEYRYIEEKTNEETAILLGMNMANYYNKHKLAKAQFCETLKREGLV